MLRALLVVLFLVLLPTPAGAHTAVVRSFPAPGQSLQQAPAELQVEFSQAVSAVFTPLIVKNALGERVDQGDAAVEPQGQNRVKVSLKPLPAGTYTAVYRVTSLDGHPVEGTITFAVETGAALPSPPQEAPTAPQAPPQTTQVPPPTTQAPPVVPDATPAAVSVVHGLALLLACLTAGARLPRRWELALLGALALTGLVEVSLYTLQASGEPWSFSLLARGVTGTRAGLLWLARLGLAGAATAKPKWLSLPAGMGLLLTFSLQSHAMATGRTLAVLVDWIHLLALAPWLGGLAGFARDPRPELVPRFSRVAAASVLTLTLTGIYSAALHIPSAAALTTTPYGRSLLFKLVLLAPVLALAAFHLVRQGKGPFRLTVRGELALIIAIFVAAGFLSTLPPPPAEPAEPEHHQAP